MLPGSDGQRLGRHDHPPMSRFLLAATQDGALEKKISEKKYHLTSSESETLASLSPDLPDGSPALLGVLPITPER
jgi:hypothetical protein